MKSLLIVVGLIALASARPQDYTVEYTANGEKICRLNCGRPFNSGCPSIPCPRPDPPALDRSCPVPNCLSADADWLLWPNADDESTFYQCPGRGVWAAIARDCGCATLFDYAAQRCVHPHEWNPQCNRHPLTPRPKECPVCPDCGEGDDTTRPTNPTNPTWPTNPTNPTWPTNPSTWPTPPTNPGNCPCICAPCIIWPCSPCPQNCPCNAVPYKEEVEE